MDDQDFQTAVDIEADRLLRLTPCDLMQIETHEVVRLVSNHEIPLWVTVRDFGDVRHIGVVAERKFLIGCRRFSRGIKVHLSMQSMDSRESAENYD